MNLLLLELFVGGLLRQCGRGKGPQYDEYENWAYKLHAILI